MGTTTYDPMDLTLKRSLSGHLNSTALLTQEENEAIQIVSCALAGASTIAAIVTFVWFARMRRKFRHNLIFILISADITRSLWIFIFCVASLSSGKIQSTSGFCQVTGFFYQSSVELADFANLAIAIHTALQIFRPTIGHVGNPRDEGGLYRFRWAIYVIGAVLPFFMASLGFAHGQPAYLSQGPFCSLPVRPFWYRLGLSWIPRYCIMLIILGLYIAIYIHVALQFRSIIWLRKAPGASKHATPGMVTPIGAYDGMEDQPRRTSSTVGLFWEWQQKRMSTLVNQTRHPRRHSTTSSSRTTLVSAGAQAGAATELDYYGVPFDKDGAPDFITSALSPVQTPTTPKAGPTGFTSIPMEASEKHSLGRSPSRKDMRKRHAAIQRQVRTLFIYPIVYFIMWLFPFIQNVMNYSNYRAQHPIFPLVLMNFICVSTIGAIDCLIFSWREKPWKTISGSDGTFLGSFWTWHHEEGRRPSTATSRSGSDDSGHTALESVPISPRRPLGSIAEDDISVSRVHDGPIHMGQFPNIPLDGPSSMDEWELEHERSGLVEPRTPEPRERHWFDRRLSQAVGRSV